MAARNVSPGGALLRTSRMFTLPAPIPQPPGDVSGGTRFHSDTSTLAFPTHQVVTTEESSRKRGDWGFKRAMPLKLTMKTTTPMIRVKQVDTVEHITDFTSAGDHGLTLRKWQELNMPLSQPSAEKNSPSLRYKRKTSVFEESGDFTAIDPEKEADSKAKRWKFRGPWLAGMTQGDFNKWLAKSVRTRRSEFREFLRKTMAAEMTKEQATATVSDADGLDFTAAEPKPPVDPKDITEEQLGDYLRLLRVDRPRLYHLVGQFLDLAPLEPPNLGPTLVQQKALGNMAYMLKSSGNPYALDGPPVTHPSAGLSYLRTASFLENHPIYGPQESHTPVQARIVQPRSAGSLSGQRAKLGVAGIIAESPTGDTRSNIRIGKSTYGEFKGLVQFDPSVEGGAKMWVAPGHASISSQGKVLLEVYDAKAEAVMVAEELIGGEKVYGTVKKSQENPELDFGLDEFKSPARRRGFYPGEPLMGGPDSYGLNLNV